MGGTNYRGIFEYDKVNNQLTMIGEFDKNLQTSIGDKLGSKSIKRGKCLLLIYNPSRPKRILAEAPTSFSLGLGEDDGKGDKLISEIGRLNRELVTRNYLNLANLELGQRLAHLYLRASNKNIAVTTRPIEGNDLKDYLNKKLNLSQEAIPLALVSMGYKS